MVHFPYRFLNLNNAKICVGEWVQKKGLVERLVPNNLYKSLLVVSILLGTGVSPRIYKLR